MTPAHNLKAINIGTGEFSFSLGATSPADTKLRGWRDFDNVVAYQLETTNERVEHEGSYRGKKRVDEIFSVKQGLEYMLRCDAFTRENLMILLMGELADNHVQDPLADSAADTLVFTSGTPGRPDRWYDLLKSGGHLRSLTSALVFAGAPVSAAGANSGDVFTAVAHGLSNGDRIILITLGTVTGPTALVPYFIINKSDDTFQISTTQGGSAVELGADGTATYLPALKDLAVHPTSGHYEFDPDLARVRFKSLVTTTAYAYLTAPAITSADDTHMVGIKPLEEASFDGYGRLVTFHQKTEKPFTDHQDFSCTVTPESVSESDGKTPATFQLRVRVTSDTGKVLLWGRAA